MNKEVEQERARCANIIDNLARILGTPYVDPNPEYNTPEKAYEMAHMLVKIAAEAIRKP